MGNPYGNCQTFYGRKFDIFHKIIHANVFLKIGIRSAKGTPKNFPNFEVCHPAPAPPRTLSIKVVIVVLYKYGV